MYRCTCLVLKHGIAVKPLEMHFKRIGEAFRKVFRIVFRI